jgi:glycosyltransferase involved in cell wall biosynthesis
MASVISINFMKDEAHCVGMMLDTLQPYVKENYVIIDDRTTDNTKEICDSRGCYTKYFKFENFGKTWNTLLKWVNGKSDWMFVLAPDETIEEKFGRSIEDIVSRIHDSKVDGVWFPRRHWADLDMIERAEQDAGWYPDWQLRLIRNDYPRIHMKHYVHEWPVGLRESIRISNLEFNHFNMYWKPRVDYNFDKMNELYNTLSEKQKRDGGKDIWPE